MYYMTFSVQVVKSSQQRLEQGFQEIARYAFMSQTALEGGKCLSHRHVHKTQMRAKLASSLKGFQNCSQVLQPFVLRICSSDVARDCQLRGCATFVDGISGEELDGNISLFLKSPPRVILATSRNT